MQTAVKDDLQSAGTALPLEQVSHPRVAVAHLHRWRIPSSSWPCHLKPRASLDLSLFGQDRLLCAPPTPDSERALRPSQRRFPLERALLPPDLGFPVLSVLYQYPPLQRGSPDLVEPS